MTLQPYSEKGFCTEDFAKDRLEALLFIKNYKSMNNSEKYSIQEHNLLLYIYRLMDLGFVEKQDGLRLSPLLDVKLTPDGEKEITRLQELRS